MIFIFFTDLLSSLETLTFSVSVSNSPPLSPPDVDVPSPDEKSVITYVSSIYDAFPKIPEGGEGIAAHVRLFLQLPEQRAGTLDNDAIIPLLCFHRFLQIALCKTKALFLLPAPPSGGGPALVRVPVQVLLSAPVEPPAYGPDGQQELPSKPCGTEGELQKKVVFLFKSGQC